MTSGWPRWRRRPSGWSAWVPSGVQRFEPGGMDSGFIVMQDPEGNEFCLD